MREREEEEKRSENEKIEIILFVCKTHTFDV
jgi:hypothetical protein